MPARSARSITATRRPCLPASSAHINPAAPPPSTNASNCWIIGMDGHRMNGPFIREVIETADSPIRTGTKLQKGIKMLNRMPQLSDHAHPRLFRVPQPEWIPNRPGQHSSRTRQFLRRWRLENKVRKHRAHLASVPVGQKPGKSWGVPRRDRKVQSPDRAPGRAHHSRNQRTVVQPLRLRPASL